MKGVRGKPSSGCGLRSDPAPAATGELSHGRFEEVTRWHESHQLLHRETVRFLGSARSEFLTDPGRRCLPRLVGAINIFIEVMSSES